MFDTPAQLLQAASYKKNLDFIIDTTHGFLIDPDKETFLKSRGMAVDPQVLSQYKIFDDNAPYKEADSFNVLEFIVKRNMSIASLVSVGGDIPSTSAGQLIKVEGGMAKIALSHIFDEKVMEQIIELREAHNIPKVFVEMLYGNVDDLQKKIFKTGNVFTAQAWYQGIVRFTDPRTGVGIEINYDTRDALFPAPLTGNDSWERRDSAGGIQNIIDHARAFYKINGFYPKCTKMSLDLIEDLMQQEATTRLAASMGLISDSGNVGLPTRVDRDVLDKMSARSRGTIPPIEEWDTQYELEIEPGRTTRVSYLPSHTYCFVQPNSIERLWGLTMESAMKQLGFGNRFARNNRKLTGGIFTKANDELKSSPPQSRCLGVGRMIPFCPDPRLLAGHKVKEG